MATDPEQLCMKNINYRRIRLIEEILTLNDLYEKLADWQNNFDRFSLPYLAPFPGLDWMINLAEAAGQNGHDGRWHQNSQFMSDGNGTSNPLHLTCVIPWNYMQLCQILGYRQTWVQVGWSKTSYFSTHFGTLTQCLVHPKVPVLLTKKWDQ